MVEHRSFGGACGAAVMVHGDAVQELCELGGCQPFCLLLNKTQPQMHVSEEAPLACLGERRSAGELTCSADVMEKRCGKHEVGTKSRMNGTRPSVRFPRRMAPICVSDPMGGARPFRMANVPAMVVVATAPRPTSSTPRRPRAGAISRGGVTTERLYHCRLRSCAG